MDASETLARLDADARAIYAAALEGVRPGALLREAPLEEIAGQPLASFRRIRVAAFGKGSIPLAAAAEELLAGLDFSGIAVVPHGYVAALPDGIVLPQKIEVIEAGHPVPDAAGVGAAEKILQCARNSSENDLLLALISGGGSALSPAFAEGISLDDARATFQLLLRSGAAIHEVNAVRKHLSRIGGGRLAAAAFPARCCALIVSDVPGDDLPVISSGPTVPDPTTFRDAFDVLSKFKITLLPAEIAGASTSACGTAAPGCDSAKRKAPEKSLFDAIPKSVRTWIERGLADPSLETPKPGDPRLARTATRLIGNNRRALEAAARHAEALGYEARIVDDQLFGEAREAGRAIAQAALEIKPAHPVCIIQGGETTVTVRGTGKGGRNQELALAAARALEKSATPIAILSGGSDGIDGPTDAAGACVTPLTVPLAHARYLSPELALQNNDAYPLLHAVGALLLPGPTHTNVMDIVITLRAPHSS